MNVKNDNRSSRVTAAIVVLAVLATGSTAYFVNQNFTVRIVRLDSSTMLIEQDVEAQDNRATLATARSANKPAPIVVRLACVDAGNSVKGIASSVVLPKRSLRQQLKQSDPAAAVPIPVKRCRPSADVLASLASGT